MSQPHKDNVLLGQVDRVGQSHCPLGVAGDLGVVGAVGLTGEHPLAHRLVAHRRDATRLSDVAPIVVAMPGTEVQPAREFVDADLRGARFVRTDLSGAVMRGV